VAFLDVRKAYPTCRRAAMLERLYAKLAAAPGGSETHILVLFRSLYMNDSATLDDLREAIATLKDAERIARRVLGGAHPTTTGIEESLRNARAALRARETSSGSA